MSYMKLGGALVLIDPLAACERETLYPALRRAELLDQLFFTHPKTEEEGDVHYHCGGCG
jgi:hypothetical protein